MTPEGRRFSTGWIDETTLMFFDPATRALPRIRPKPADLRPRPACCVVPARPAPAQSVAASKSTGHVSAPQEVPDHW